jgi:hypothetical protein
MKTLFSLDSPVVSFSVPRFPLRLPENRVTVSLSTRRPDMNKLELLNQRRVSLGMKPLRSWKGSKAKLEEAITALGHAPTTEKPTPAPKPRAVTKAVPTAKPVPTPTPAPLPRIARSLGMDPKAARAALRKIHACMKPMRCPAFANWASSSYCTSLDLLIITHSPRVVGVDLGVPLRGFLRENYAG